MTELIGPLVAFAFLCGVFAVMFRSTRGRVGAPPRGFATRRRSPDDARWVAAALGGLAIGSALGAWLHADTVAGLVVGGVIGLSLSIPVLRSPARLVLNIVALVIAVVSAALFVVGDDMGTDSTSTLYRFLTVGLILGAFALGVVLPDHRSAFAGDRGLALFGVVEVATFLAAPGGRDAMHLGALTNVAYLPIAAGIAMLIGWLASEFVLGILSVAVAVTVWFRESVFGDPYAGWAGLVTAVAAVATVVLLSRIVGRSGIAT